jgi:outer membrane protein OmpA-like peptidoglycan-associated protein
VKKDTPYLLKAMQNDYTADCLPFSFDVAQTRNDLSIPRDLLLDKLAVNRKFELENIYYDFDKWNIRKDAEPALNKLVRIMKENLIFIELGSHTDCRGSYEYNIRLSQHRAESAVQYIVFAGINRSRITSRWYGKLRLTNNCNCSEGIHCTEAQHQANRRTEFKVSLPVVNLTGNPFDLSKYREGDTLDLQLLPPDFFKDCDHRMLSGSLTEPLNSSTLLSQEQNSNLLYTVQVGAFSHSKPCFNNLSDVMSCKGSDGILRCFVGKFSSKAEAIWYRDHLKSGEFTDAFVTVMDDKHQPSDSNQGVYLSKK